MRPLWQDAHQTEQAITQELAKVQPDSTRLAQLSDQLTNDQQRLQLLAQQKLAELKQQLTPAQYAQMLVSRHAMARSIHRQSRGAHGSSQQQQPR